MTQDTHELELNPDFVAYNDLQESGDRAICDALLREITRNMPDATSKIWHGAPVWFLDGNPIVGYHKLKGCVRLLFWSGQSFDEDGLHPEGTFKAAEKRYRSVDEVQTDELERWLEKSKHVQWDYKNIRKQRGLIRRIV